MINIKPSSALRTRYNEISNLCKTTHEPVFITKNGEGDMVVMDILDYNLLIHKDEIDQALAMAQEYRKNGGEYLSIDEFSRSLTETIETATKEDD
ncbi:MAG: type II toxin-antitoxin system Phd/YefM family antitoxin [Clostridiales bacterium]|nr:type II toxin-antitoxin system Phd/YefM family antitoxin [Clostridiales bacterium]